MWDRAGSAPIRHAPPPKQGSGPEACREYAATAAATVNDSDAAGSDSGLEACLVYVRAAAGAASSAAAAMASAAAATSAAAAESDEGTRCGGTEEDDGSCHISGCARARDADDVLGELQAAISAAPTGGIGGVARDVRDGRIARVTDSDGWDVDVEEGWIGRSLSQDWARVESGGEAGPETGSLAGGAAGVVGRSESGGSEWGEGGKGRVAMVELFLGACRGARREGPLSTARGRLSAALEDSSASSMWFTRSPRRPCLFTLSVHEVPAPSLRPCRLQGPSLRPCLCRRPSLSALFSC